MRRPRATAASVLARALPLALALSTGTVVGWAAAAPASGAIATAASPSSARGVWATTPGGAEWSSLTPAQRQVLAPLATEWNGLDATGKEKWLEVAGRFPRMGADEQSRVRARMVEWVHMSPQQRSQARLVFQETRDVSKEQRQALWQQYQSLPDDKKKELAQKELARRGPASAPGAASAAHARAASGADGLQAKSNVVKAPNPSAASPRAVAPVVVQARPGATTTLITKTPTPPAHQREGQPKIAVGPNDVDPTTLLPRRGAQVAASATVGRARAAGASHPGPAASHP